MRMLNMGSCWPVRTLNMGWVERGLGTSRLAAICRSSSVFSRMVKWWNIWMLGAQDRQSRQPGSQPPDFGVQPDTASEPPYRLPYCYVGEPHTRDGQREDKQDVLWRQLRGL